MPKGYQETRGGYRPTRRTLDERARNPKTKSRRVELVYEPCGHKGTATVFEGQDIPKAANCPTCYWKQRLHGNWV